MAKFQKGDSIQFRDPAHAKYWFLKGNVGTVVDTKPSYRDTAAVMVYAEFESKRVYGDENAFDLIVHTPAEHLKR